MQILGYKRNFIASKKCVNIYSFFPFLYAGGAAKRIKFPQKSLHAPNSIARLT
jgi:hypothetical protein